jgi:hypothetical protein
MGYIKTFWNETIPLSADNLAHLESQVDILETEMLAVDHSADYYSISEYASTFYAYPGGGHGSGQNADTLNGMTKDELLASSVPTSTVIMWHGNITFASVTTHIGTSNSELTWTWKVAGETGNDESIRYVYGTSLSITRSDHLTTVFFINNSTTAAQIKAKLQADAGLSQLWGITYPTGNNGSGKVSVVSSTQATGGVPFPEGFLYCNGAGGTPDMRDKLPLGGSYNVRTSGGHAASTWEGTIQVGSHVLTQAETAIHTHNFTDHYPAGTAYCNSYTENQEGRYQWGSFSDYAGSGTGNAHPHDGNLENGANNNYPLSKAVHFLIKT